MRVVFIMIISLNVLIDSVVAEQSVVRAYPKFVFLADYAFDEIATEIEPRGIWRRHEVALVVGGDFHKAVVDARKHLTVKFIQRRNGIVDARAGMEVVDVGDVATRVEVKTTD